MHRVNQSVSLWLSEGQCETVNGRTHREAREINPNGRIDEEQEDSDRVTARRSFGNLRYNNEKLSKTEQPPPVEQEVWHTLTADTIDCSQHSSDVTHDRTP